MKTSVWKILMRDVGVALMVRTLSPLTSAKVPCQDVGRDERRALELFVTWLRCFVPEERECGRDTCRCVNGIGRRPVRFCPQGKRKLFCSLETHELFVALVFLTLRPLT